MVRSCTTARADNLWRRPREAQHEALSAALDSWNAGDLDGYLRLYDEGKGTGT
jgi:hypothetical protein